jgi:TRAP-type C4-dicarboxylate transport system permease small subunit
MYQQYKLENSLRWVARILTILFAGFLGIFSLDVFQENYRFWMTALDLLIHLIPSFIILLVLWISWKREWIAAIIYFLMAILYLIYSWGRFPAITYIVVSGPLFVVSILNLYCWLKSSGKKY